MKFICLGAALLQVDSMDGPSLLEGKDAFTFWLEPSQKSRQQIQGSHDGTGIDDGSAQGFDTVGRISADDPIIETVSILFRTGEVKAIGPSLFVEQIGTGNEFPGRLPHLPSPKEGSSRSYPVRR